MLGRGQNKRPGVRMCGLETLLHSVSCPDSVIRSSLIHVCQGDSPLLRSLVDAKDLTSPHITRVRQALDAKISATC